jgi:hypothetical protein
MRPLPTHATFAHHKVLEARDQRVDTQKPRALTRDDFNLEIGVERNGGQCHGSLGVTDVNKQNLGGA